VKAAWLAAIPLLLPGCAIRGGMGYSSTASPEQAHRTYDAEVGLILPIEADEAGPTWVGSALAIVRTRTSEGGWTELGLEAVRRFGEPPGEGESRGSCPTKEAIAGNFLGGRLEAGRDGAGNYVGGAAVLRRSFLPGLCPFSPTVSLVLNAGAYVGPSHGPAVGLHLLFGFN
jgi:hypothetical protein